MSINFIFPFTSHGKFGVLSRSSKILYQLDDPCLVLEKCEEFQKVYVYECILREIKKCLCYWLR